MYSDWIDIVIWYHNDAEALTYSNVKLHVTVISIFNVVLMSDKDENETNNDKYVLFHLSKYSDKFYIILFIEMSIQIFKY